jgi:hypothetical protein
VPEKVNQSGEENIRKEWDEEVWAAVNGEEE